MINKQKQMTVGKKNEILETRKYLCKCGALIVSFIVPGTTFSKQFLLSFAFYINMSFHKSSKVCLYAHSLRAKCHVLLFLSIFKIGILCKISESSEIHSQIPEFLTIPKKTRIGIWRCIQKHKFTFQSINFHNSSNPFIQ